MVAFLVLLVVLVDARCDARNGRVWCEVDGSVTIVERLALNKKRLLWPPTVAAPILL